MSLLHVDFNEIFFDMPQIFQQTYGRSMHFMSNVLFSVFPNERFVDLGLYQYGWEQCTPLHSYGPYVRNHYLFHYVISGPEP